MPPPFRSSSTNGVSPLPPSTASSRSQPPPPIPPKTGSPAKYWPFSKAVKAPGDRSITPDTFAEASPTATHSDVEALEADSRPLYDALDLPRAPNASSSSSSYQWQASQRGSKTPTATKTSSQIGQSFETLLASNETRVLKHPTPIADNTAPDSPTTSLLSMPPDSPQIPTRGTRLGVSSDQTNRRVLGTDGLVATTSSPPSSPERANLAHRLSSHSMASRIASPRRELRGKAASLRDHDPLLNSPKGSVSELTTKASAKNSPYDPSPTISLRALPPDDSRQSNYRDRSLSRAKPNGSDLGAFGARVGNDATALNSSEPSSDPSSHISQNTQGGLRDRIKRTSGFLKRFTSRDGGGSSHSDERRGYGKENLPGARMSTPSLYSVPTTINQVSNSSSGTASLPPSPLHNKTRAALGLETHPVPVPAIPAKYADVSHVGKGLQSRSRPDSSHGSTSQDVSFAPAARAVTSMAEHRSAALAAPIILTPASRSVSAPSATTEHTVPLPPSRATSRVSSEGKSKRSAHTASGSGAGLRSTLQAWENEMDSVLKESAQDLDKKTKISDGRRWQSSPRLPELGLQLDIDDDEQAVEAALGPGTRRRQNDGEFAASQDASGTTGQAFRSSGRDSRPISSLSASKVQIDGKPLHRPWERSRSPFLSQGESTTSPTSSAAMASTLSADGHFLPRLPNRAENASDVTSPSASQQTSIDLPAAGTLLVLPTGIERTAPNVLPTPPQSARGKSAGSELPGSISSRSGKTRDSVSGASIVTFETAAESEDVPPVPLIGNRRLAQEQLRGSREEADEDDDDSIVVPPEESIRLVSKTGPMVSSSLAQDSADDSVLTVTPSSDLLIRDESLRHPSRDHSTVAPLLSDTLGRRTMPLSSTQAVVETQRSREATQSFPESAAPSVKRAPSTQAKRRHFAGSLQESESDSVPDQATDQRAKELAERCWNEDESWMHKEKIAEWLGGLGELNEAARHHYMDKFDFKNTRVDGALRLLCDKLFLRGETQQVDRILAAFSRRYWVCNPSSAYGSADNIHAIVFSLLLLNTDLHVADISERMTKQQFVKNTMSALNEAGNTDHDSGYGSRSRNGGGAWSPPYTDRDSDSMSLQSGVLRADQSGVSLSFDNSKISRRESISSLSHNQHGGIGGSFSKGSLPRSSPVPPQANLRADSELENTLKEMYTAVKNDRIKLPMSEVAPPDHLKSFPGRKSGRSNLGPPSASANGSNRVSQMKRGSIRGMAGLLGVNTGMRAEENSGFMGTASSFGSRSPSESGTGPAGIGGSSAINSNTIPPLQPPQPLSLGFANTLFQNVIKEAQDESKASGGGHRPTSIASTIDDLDDNELALFGAPWAKEGVLSRKHYWDAPQKRAKDKNWTETFVVVQKGTLSMFKFGENSATTGSKSYGGGNWLSNATSLGEISLAHTLANTLPPPGYNRARPYVLALTLPSGAVYFFQAGTEDLVQEWVSTCNYWAARTSRPPLPAAVSNMEYGWNRVLPISDDNDGEGVEGDEPGEYLMDDGDTSATTWSTLATPPDGSIYQSFPSRSGGGNVDNRSVRSGRSGRSMASSTGGTYYQSWQNAASSLLGSSGGKGGRSSRAPSISSGYVGGGLSPPSARNRPPASIRSLSFSPSVSSSGTSTFANDRTYINDWKAPVAPRVPSTLKEEEQMEACVAFISRTEAELTSHTELRQPMLALYNPRGPNYSKALSNWERKSNHLLAELVKWKGYVESLNAAHRAKIEKRDMRAMDSALARADEEMANVKEGEVEGPILV